MEGLDSTDLIAFFNKRDMTCPVCGGKEWAVTPPDHKIINIYVKDKSTGFPIPPPNIPAIAAICASCGFMSMHEYNYLKTAVLKEMNQQE